MVALATRTTSQPELPVVLATVGRFVRYRMWWWFPSSLWWLWFKPFFLFAVSVLFAQTRRRPVVASLFQIFAVVASLASPEFSCGGFVLIEGWIWICSLMFWIVDVFFKWFVAATIVSLSYCRGSYLLILLQVGVFCNSVMWLELALTPQFCIAILMCFVTGLLG